MKWIVTLKMDAGPDATVEVFAPSKNTAEYRAAYKAETLYNRNVLWTIAARKLAA